MSEGDHTGRGHHGFVRGAAQAYMSKAIVPYVSATVGLQLADRFGMYGRDHAAMSMGGDAAVCVLKLRGYFDPRGVQELVWELERCNYGQACHRALVEALSNSPLDDACIAVADANCVMSPCPESLPIS